MEPFSKHARSYGTLSSREKYIATVGIILPAVTLVFWNTWANYSYWLDEIYSASAVSHSWHALFSDWILTDTHPPLYLLLLKVWVAIFGTAEGVTRILSGLFATSALLLLAWCYRYEHGARSIATIAYFAAAPAFAYYGQETRSNALMLLLSTAVTLITVRQFVDAEYRKHLRYGLMLLLSLTHFFGLIYVGIIVLADLYRIRDLRTRIELVVVGSLALVWPILHAAVGDLIMKSGGLLWVQSTGPLSTVKSFLMGVAPSVASIAEQLKDSAGTLVAAAIIAAVLVCAVIPIARMSAEARRKAAYLSLIMMVFVVLVAVIDLRSPISIPRNYIVLLPAVAVLFGIAFDALFRFRASLWWRLIVTAGAAAFLINSGLESVDRLTSKWEPHQNWKQLSAEVVSWKLCEPHCIFVGGFGLHPYYFGRSASGAVAKGSVTTPEQAAAMAPTNTLPIIGLPGARQDFAELRAAYVEWNCYEPRQSWGLSTFILTSERLASDRLRRCREP